MFVQQFGQVLIFDSIREVSITLSWKTQLSTSEFMRLLELIDKIYTEILPLGSVIQINDKVTQRCS